MKLRVILDRRLKFQNPFGGGRQIILDVAVTGVDGQSRRRSVDVDAPLNSRFYKKIRKCEQVAICNGFKVMPAVFSHTGQIHHRIMALIRRQIDYELQLQSQQRQHDSWYPMLKVWIRKLPVVIS